MAGGSTAVSRAVLWDVIGYSEHLIYEGIVLFVLLFRLFPQGLRTAVGIYAAYVAAVLLSHAVYVVLQRSGSSTAGIRILHLVAHVLMLALTAFAFVWPSHLALVAVYVLCGASLCLCAFLLILRHRGNWPAVH